MKTIKLSVQEFAIPTPMSGSISPGGGLAPNLMKGIELHQSHQKQQKKSNSDYVAEKKISHKFERSNWIFSVEGRMDGFVPGVLPLIEEIKTSTSIKELGSILRSNPLSHSYGLQLMTYGYFYWLQFAIWPELQFTLISTRERKSDEFKIHFDQSLYEAWLKIRLEELEIETEKAEKRVARRKKLVEKLAFPFQAPRPGQMELIECIDKGFAEKKHLMLQAPTGLGKTIGVLYPSLKESLNRGQKVVYVTPKNSQQSVAEEALAKIQELGCKVKAMTITAKSKICMKDETICDPSYCEYAKDYYDKLHQHGIIDELAKKKKMTSRIFKALAEKYTVCPFELQLDGLKEADVVIADYNHVFSERGSLKRLALQDHAQTGKPNLVIDEAHNLPARAMSYFSPVLSSAYLESLKNEAQSKRVRVLIEDCARLVNEYAQTTKKVITVSADPFIKIDERIKTLLFEGVERDETLLKLSFLWSEFLNCLELTEEGEKSEFFVSFIPDQHGGSLKITCCDASELIKDKYKDYENVVAFSATMKPFDYYVQLTGLKSERLITEEFRSPFDPNRRKILLIPQISTKYSDRERQYSKIAETIFRVTEVRKGNYLAFFPSFDFLEKTVACFTAPPGFRLVKQERNLKKAQVEIILEDLRKLESPTIVFAVQGGVFSEGVDYAGDMAIGAFVVGPPLPNFDFERERMKEYYAKVYNEGFDFAYSYPAMAKAVQSAGRVIRSENDKGIIILMDSRFLSPSYTKSMPQDWFNETPHELVSSGIISDLKGFWDSAPL